MRAGRQVRERRRGRAVLMAVLVLAALAGCGDDDGTAGDAGTATSVEAKGFRFDPEEIRVEVGGEVRWRNGDTVRHTVTADDGSFTLDLDEEGTSGAHRFDEAGTVTYHCELHPQMTGTVVVE